MSQPLDALDSKQRKKLYFTEFTSEWKMQVESETKLWD
jgi:hypothetical protein